MAVLASLLETELLRGLSPTTVEDFLGRVTLHRIPPGTVLGREGEVSDRAFLPISGRIKVLRHGENGKVNLLYVAGFGDMIGDLSIFDGLVQSVTTVSVGPVESAVLSAESLREWLSSSPEAWTRYIRVQQFRLEQVIDAHNDMFGLDVSARVADAILREAHRFGVRTPEGLRVSLVLSHEELALHVRASRERVTQVLGSLIRMGWICRDGSDLVIIDESRLMHRAGRLLASSPVTD